MDFYILLGIERGATLSDIKRAYRRLARRYHPDINPGDRTAAAQFRQIAEAYETLIDPDRRRRYDAGGGAAAARVESTFGFEGFDFSVSVSGAVGSDLRRSVRRVLQQRGARAATATPERGADLHQTLSLAFEEAMRGGQRHVTVTRQEHCRACRGTGRLQAAETPVPATATASGIVKSARGHMVFSKPCAHCGGTGAAAAAALPDLRRRSRSRCGPSR